MYIKLILFVLVVVDFLVQQILLLKQLKQFPRRLL